MSGRDNMDSSKKFTLSVGSAIVQTEVSDCGGRRQLSGHKHQFLVSFYL